MLDTLVDDTFQQCITLPVGFGSTLITVRLLAGRGDAVIRRYPATSNSPLCIPIRYYSEAMTC